MTDVEERAMPPEVRARLRRELRAIALTPDASTTSRRWLAPVGVAAAVAAVVSAGALLSRDTGSEPSDGVRRVPPTATASMPAHVPGSTIQVQSVEGVRTDADSLVLVAAYIGGSCDGPARLRARETADAVVLSLEIERPPDRPPTRINGRIVHYVCEAAGYPRTARVQLAAPLGKRTVVDAGTTPRGGRNRRLTVVDGSHLLAPTALPSGYQLAVEMPSMQDDGLTVTGWSRWWSVPVPTPPAPPAGATPSAAPPSPPSVLLTQGRRLAPEPGMVWQEEKPVKVGSATARLYREPSSDWLVLRWTDPRTRTACALQVMPKLGDTYSPREIVALADSLIVAP